MSCYGIEETLEKLKGKKVTKVEVSEDRTKMTLHIEGGEPVRLGVEGDCCSSSFIYDAGMESWQDVVLTGEMEDISNLNVENHPQHDSLSIYVQRFKAEDSRGIVVIWANASNGYYSGYWVNA